MTLLKVSNLTQRYGNHVAVNHIDLSVEAGQLVAFLGPNGAGKSTTINMLTGITRPQSGTIDLAGLKPGTRAYRHQIGVVFQNSVLDADLTVRQNLMWRAGMYKQIDNAFVTRLMQAFDIETIAGQKYGSLSGGQRRRVDITRALLHKPRLLFLDEPSTGLDIQTRNKIWAVLNQLRVEFQMTIILTTHYLEEANIADYVYVIDHGEIIAADTVSDLKAKYAKDVLRVTTTDMAKLTALVDPQWPTTVKGHQVEIMVPDVDATIRFLTAARPLITGMELKRGDMNDIFVALTGKEIR
ncbi:ABC transporter ATP-binding protein [Nicoliella spurrieriana]|uniref:ABC transporter ATP-binding protein n=1 Tax=Nicoliella spurrieriana TaxID=2925830 RepID=A0A976RSZ2_9LACO|nr:ABC transporter ATP-binding protein [Nicoliella spurrieriana]UQS87350.1 ABC transporter ATP-binding protein [Nicoliella spurrieriana]